MTLTSALLVALLANGPVNSVEQVDVAYDAIASGENIAAIEQIESNDTLAQDDPSRLINLGIAYAREGDIARARDLFRAALYSTDRQLVETADGDWVDSRSIARRALAQLDEAEANRFRQVAFAQSE